MSDLTAIVLYTACLTLGVMTLVVIMVTGAFFSRGTGTVLASWGILVSIGILITAVLAPAGAWPLAAPGFLLAPIFGLLFLASLGGEK